MLKRIFDFIFSLLGLILLSPLFIIISLLILLDSRGGIFFRQKRVGAGDKDFMLYKFRTMVAHAEKQGQLTIGAKDLRITSIGYYLRKFKLDELPQLLNVLSGDMSFVGPRPEVRKYTELYDEEQRKVLLVKPGITDYASMEYVNENEILGRSLHPEKTYIEEIMPAKLKLNAKYIKEQNLSIDIRIILATLGKIFSKKGIEKSRQ